MSLALIPPKDNNYLLVVILKPSIPRHGAGGSSVNEFVN